MKRGDLDDLAVFARIARTRSFTRAASEIGLSPSTLSHTMRALEMQLGVRLLARTTRSVALTAAGERLLVSLEPALLEVSRGVSALADRRDAPSGTLRLTTFGYAARTILSPKLPRFLVDHPDITVEVVVDDRPIDLVANGFDGGIRLVESVEQDMIGVCVGPELRTVVVGTSDYFNRHQPPVTPTDLNAHICVNYRLVGGGGLLPWEFERDRRKTKVQVGGQLIVNDETLASSAVRSGAGLGYMMEHDVAGEIADGRLVQVLDDWCVQFHGPYRRTTPGTSHESVTPRV